MSSITVYRCSASQRPTPISNASQRPTTISSASQYRNQNSPVNNHTFIRPPASSQSSVQASSYYGPVRSYTTHSQINTPNANNQHRASPYTVNSPRTNRRQMAAIDNELDVQPEHSQASHSQINHSQTSHPQVNYSQSGYLPPQNEQVHLVNPTNVNHNTLNMINERFNILEQEIRLLQAKVDKLLKIALASMRNEQEFPVTKPKTKPNPILWNDQNLLEKPRTALPTTYLCHLVRKVYTAEEIKNKVPQLPPKDGDVRLEKIKECLVTLYFSHEPSLIEDFMATKGHESLYNQERTKRSRDKLRAERIAPADDTSHNVKSATNNIIEDCGNLDINTDSDLSDDLLGND